MHSIERKFIGKLKVIVRYDAVVPFAGNLIQQSAAVINRRIWLAQMQQIQATTEK